MVSDFWMNATCAAVFRHTSGVCIGFITRGTKHLFDQDSNLLIAPIAAGEEITIDHACMHRMVTMAGPTCGEYRGYQIPEWLQMRDGAFYHYVCIAPILDIETIRQGTIVLSPGLVYHNDTSATIHG